MRLRSIRQRKLFIIMQIIKKNIWGLPHGNNEFLAFRRYEVLPDKNKGSVSRQTAWDKAHKEYDIFNKTQVIHSDFDDMVRELLGKQGDADE